MSHFTVTVRLTEERLKRHGGDVDSALEEIMAPYNEQPEDGSPFLKFQDQTEEVLKEYAEGSCERVRAPDGKMYSPWDEKFRAGATHLVPTGYKKVTLPFREVYLTVESFAKDWHGFSPRRGAQPGESIGDHAREIDTDLPVRYGYVRNPNAKWDWYQIGGRWRGHFPLKPGKVPVIGRAGTFDNEAKEGCGDVVKVGDIDFDRVAWEARESARKFHSEWRDYFNGSRRDTGWDGPRKRALELGLCRVVQGPAEAGVGEVAAPWRAFVKDDDKRASWTDILICPPEDEFVSKYGPSFSVVTTYAALDDDGWHAPGEMGWWGMSSDKAEDRLAFDRAFTDKFIRAAGPEDVLVLVDCHI